MNIREYNLNRELSTSELDIVTGGTLKEIVQNAMAAALKATGTGGYLGKKTGISELSNYQL